jgi:hypothetical protein
MKGSADSVGASSAPYNGYTVFVECACDMSDEQTPTKRFFRSSADGTSKLLLDFISSFLIISAVLSPSLVALFLSSEKLYSFRYFCQLGLLFLPESYTLSDL